MPVKKHTDNSSYNRSTGINMFYKNVWRHTSHNIPEKSAANSCDGSKKYQKEHIIHIAMGNSCIYSYHCKNPQTYRVHYKHHFVVSLPVMSLQQVFFQIENQKYYTGSNGCHQSIHRMLEHGRWNNPKNHIPDSSPSN